MLKYFVVLAVLCGLSASYSVHIPNGFMYYQQPVGYRLSQRNVYGSHFQKQQLPSTDVETPVQGDNVESVAAAYPSEQYPVEDVAQQDNPAVYEEEAEEPLADESIASSVVPVAIPAEVSKNKKKLVPVADDSNEQGPQNSGRGASSGSANPNVYFPINFSKTDGSAIAIANSYSTGKGGSATSTAIAYGKPAAAELKRTAPVQLKRKPSKLRVRQH